jgi:hypothetical protein
MNHILLLMVSDGLMMPSGMVAPASYRCLIYCKVPADWVEGEIPESDDLWLKGPELTADKLENVFEALYGKTWRMGNSDGSTYVVRACGQRLLNPLSKDEKPWEYDNPNSPAFRYFYYIVDADGNFKPALPSQLE